MICWFVDVATQKETVKANSIGIEETNKKMPKHICRTIDSNEHILLVHLCSVQPPITAIGLVLWASGFRTDVWCYNGGATLLLLHGIENIGSIRYGILRTAQKGQSNIVSACVPSCSCFGCIIYWRLFCTRYLLILTRVSHCLRKPNYEILRNIFILLQEVTHGSSVSWTALFMSSCMATTLAAFTVHHSNKICGWKNRLHKCKL